MKDNNILLRNEIIKILSDYDFNCNFGKSIFGVKYFPQTTYRDKNKNLITTLGRRYVYISDEMYPNTDKNFRYAIIETPCNVRNYRCKRWNESVIDKVFTSGKTDEELIENIRNLFN
jgi:hypothetical protein